MRPLYDARVSDLGPGDLVQVECTACGHSELLTAALLGTAGLRPHTVIMELVRRMRCRECDTRGQDDFYLNHSTQTLGFMRHVGSRAPPGALYHQG
jgi:hypothetical protein